jgi:transposase-like protein
MLRHVADQLRQKWPKLAAFIDDSETDVLSYLDFPEQHRSKLHSTNPLERKRSLIPTLRRTTGMG